MTELLPGYESFYDQITMVILAQLKMDLLNTITTSSKPEPLLFEGQPHTLDQTAC